MARCEATYGVPMLEAYGMTEASHEMAANPLPPGERRPGSVGVATGAALRIVDGLERRAAGRSRRGGGLRPGVTPGYLERRGEPRVVL